MKVKWFIDTGFSGAEHSGEWEVADDATDEDLNEALEVEIHNRIDAGWSKS